MQTPIRRRISLILAAAMASLALVGGQLISTATPATAASTMIIPASGTVSGQVYWRCPGNGVPGKVDNGHLGVDVFNATGTPIAAAAEGTVIFRGWSGGYGNQIRIQHAGGWVTTYSHLNSFAVSNGASVQQGTIIGGMGNTGGSYGTHLHFEVWQGSTPQTSINGSFPCGVFVSRGASINASFPGLDAPDPIGATDRSFSLTPEGTLHGKESMFAPVIDMAYNIVAADADGETLATVDSSGNVQVKRGALNSTWVPLASNAKDVAVDGDRFVVLHRDGTVTAKDGLFSTTWVTLMGGAAKIDAAAGRIGVLGNDGVLNVKEGSLYSTWVNEHPGVTDFSLDGSRIGIVAGGVAHVKEGDLLSGWVALADASRIEVEGNRIAVLDDGVVNIKEGHLYALWVPVAENTTDMALSGDRVAVVQGGTLSIKVGALTAGWIEAFSNSRLAFFS